MHVFVTGASGLVGRQLVHELERTGHRVTRLVRRPARASHERSWLNANHSLDVSVLEGCDALVHLAGESIAALRWTKAKKQAIYESRISTTSMLADTIARMENRPQCFIVASAVGYYGNRDDEALTEQNGPGSGFLSEVCRDWEQAADAVRELTRVVHIRTGMVVSRQGGALKSMLPAFRCWAGGPIGSGKQYWSWISLRDLVMLYGRCIDDETYQGPVNGVAPHPLTNREFTTQLSQYLRVPACLPLPGFAVKVLLGEMGNELLLASHRVVPAVATKHQFEFQHPHLINALESGE